MSDLAYKDYMWTARGFRQRDLDHPRTYDAAYLEERYAKIAPKCQVLANARLMLLNALLYDRVKPGQLRLLDYGCGTGAFHQIARHFGYDSWGTDLVDTGLPHFVQDWMDLGKIDVLTCFDSLEHLACPDGLIVTIDPEWVMISIPECHYAEDETWFMTWKHRRPNEHLWHWNRKTLDQFMHGIRYEPILHSTFEDHFRPNPDQKETNILTAFYGRKS